MATNEELSFEDAFHRLEQSVAALDQGRLPLDEALAFFEQGMELVRVCGERLNQAELRVRQLTETLENDLALHDATPVYTLYGDDAVDEVEDV